MRTTNVDKYTEMVQKIDEIMKSVDAFKRLWYYQKNSNVWRKNEMEIILNSKDMHYAWFLVHTSIPKMETAYKNLKKATERGNRKVTDLVDNLYYAFDDATIAVKAVSDGICKIDILNRHPEWRSISATGKNLGLQELMYRLFTAMSKMDLKMKEIKNIADNIYYV